MQGRQPRPRLQLFILLLVLQGHANTTCSLQAAGRAATSSPAVNSIKPNTTSSTPSIQQGRALLGSPDSIIDNPTLASSKLAYVLLTNVRAWNDLTRILKQIHTHLRPWTPGDLLVFHNGELTDCRQEELKDAVPDVQIHRVPTHRWQLPKELNASQQASWRSNKTVGYRHMCRWYSNGLFHVLKPLGYKWVWRLDEDSQVPQEVRYDVIEKLEASKQLYGYRAWSHDNIKTCWSLPEMTAWYIVAHKLKSPWLLQSCKPKTVAGLNSYGGWNARIIYNNIFIANIDFWLQPKVQHFLSMLDASHGYYLYRWGDAPVHTMVTGIFMTKDKLHQFNFTYCHKKKCWKSGQL